MVRGGRVVRSPGYPLVVMVASTRGNVPSYSGANGTTAAKRLCPPPLVEEVLLVMVRGLMGVMVEVRRVLV